jgi:hypothetical protein
MQKIQNSGEETDHMSKTNRRDFLISTAPIAVAPLLLPIFSQHLLAHPSVEKSSLSIAPAETQGDWRYCDKCEVLFFNGAANKGRCPAGGGHEAQGFNFLLPYGNLPEIPHLTLRSARTIEVLKEGQQRRIQVMK